MDQENCQYHSPETTSTNRNWLKSLWPLFIIFLLAPAVAAYLAPTTGIYIVDLFVAAAPLLIAATLLLSIFFIVLRINRLILGKSKESSVFLNYVYLVIIFGVSLGVGFWLGQKLENAMIERFGEVSHSNKDDQLPPIDDVRDME